MGWKMSGRRGSAVRSDALFASALQPSQQPGGQQVRQSVAAAVRRLGARGCRAGGLGVRRAPGGPGRGCGGPGMPSPWRSHGRDGPGLVRASLRYASKKYRARAYWTEFTPFLAFRPKSAG